MTAQTAALVMHRQFDVTRVLADIAALAQERFAGRRIGTQGHDQARDWLVARMQQLDLHLSLFSFALTTPVIDVYAPIQLEVAGRALQRRRDFSEHHRSADCPLPRTGRVALWQLDTHDWRDHWVRLPDVPRGPALTALAEEVRQAGGIGLLIPQPSNAQGYLVKRVVMGDPVGLPILVVREALLPILDDQQITVTMPVRPLHAQGALVIGQIEGSDEALTNAPLIIGAHYDGVGSDPGGPHFPCVTDNAAGVAVMLEVAHLLQVWEEPFRHTVRFVAFDGEETNAQGAHAYAQQLRDLGESPLVLNLDGAARWYGHLTVEVGVGAEALIPALDHAGQWLGLPLEQGPVSSDNRRFSGAGFPAAGISAGFAGMHTPVDAMEQVAPEALHHTGSFVLATLLHLHMVREEAAGS